MTQFRSRFIATALVASGLLLADVAHADPSFTANKHLGVGSCAAGPCHGKLAPVTGTNANDNSNVAQNEYRRWQSDDLHSQAYTVLESAKAKQMATASKFSPAPGLEEQSGFITINFSFK